MHVQPDVGSCEDCVQMYRIGFKLIIKAKGGTAYPNVMCCKPVDSCSFRACSSASKPSCKRLYGIANFMVERTLSTLTAVPTMLARATSLVESAACSQPQVRFASKPCSSAVVNTRLSVSARTDCMVANLAGVGLWLTSYTLWLVNCSAPKIEEVYW